MMLCWEVWPLRTWCALKAEVKLNRELDTTLRRRRRPQLLMRLLAV